MVICFANGRIPFVRVVSFLFPYQEFKFRKVIAGSINGWRCRISLSLGESVKPTVIADTPPDAGRKDSDQSLLYSRVFYSFTFYRLK